MATLITANEIIQGHQLFDANYPQNKLKDSSIELIENIINAQLNGLLELMKANKTGEGVFGNTDYQKFYDYYLKNWIIYKFVAVNYFFLTNDGIYEYGGFAHSHNDAIPMKNNDAIRTQINNILSQLEENALAYYKINFNNTPKEPQIIRVGGFVIG